MKLIERLEMNKEHCIKIISHFVSKEHAKLEKIVQESKLEDKNAAVMDYMLNELNDAMKYLKENLK